MPEDCEIKLCGEGTCTSCAACANVCTRNAIRMMPDTKGFPRPIIDSTICIKCHSCEQACPVLAPRISVNNPKPTAYAAWHPDDRVRWYSSSGGAFSCLAEDVLKRGGVVFGAAWNKDLLPELICIEDAKDLHLLRESKYVQSIVGESLKKAKQLLESGREVLFSGSPCQIAALYAVLGNKRYSNLTTVDFICHAMPSPAVFKKYIAALEQGYGSKIVAFRFRDKSIGVESNLLAKITLQTGVECNLFLKKNAFANAFINNIISKPACAKCFFNLLPRQADFSLADYRGLGEHRPFAWEADKVKGFTGVLVNSKHGENFLAEMQPQTWVSRPLEELSGSQAHLKGPVCDSARTPAFWAEFDKLSWDQLVERFLAPSKKYRRYIMARRVLGPSLFLRLGLILKTIKGIRTTGMFLPQKPMALSNE